MARLFDDSQSEYLHVDATPITARPLSMACWVRIDDNTTHHVPVCIAQSTGNNLFAIYAGDSATYSNHAVAQSYDGTSNVAQTTTSWTTNTWHHLLAVFNTGGVDTIYLNGGGKGTNSTGRTPTGLNRISVGRLGYNNGSGSQWYVSGAVAEVAIWNAALTDAEAFMLATGCSPLEVRRANLKPLYRLLNNDADRNWLGVTTYNLTAFNTPSYSLSQPPVRGAASPQLVTHGGKVIKAVGVATQVNTAQPITKRKKKTLGQPSETDSAQAVTRRKKKEIAPAVTADNAFAITAISLKAIGQVVETDTAQAVTKRKRKEIASAVSADKIFKITAVSTKAIGQATETDTAQAVAHKKRKTVGQVVETDIAQPAPPYTKTPVGQAVETDIAQTITPVKVTAEVIIEAKTLISIVRTDTNCKHEFAKTLRLADAHKDDKILDVGTTEVAYTIAGDIGNKGFLFIENLDATNFLNLGYATGVYPNRIRPGTAAMPQLAPTQSQLFLKADGAPVRALVHVTEQPV